MRIRSVSRPGKSLLLLICITLFLTTVSGAGFGRAFDVQAAAVAAGDADSSTVRVKLSVGDVPAVSMTINGTYSVAENPLPSGTYTVSNSAGVLTLANQSGVVFHTASEAFMIQEHQNPDAKATSLITLKADGVTRSYRGSMKIWPAGNWVEVVNHIYLEKYLYGVVGYEMSNTFPLEALKAQAVAARCYAVKRLERTRDPRYDIGDTSSDQVYKGYDASLNNVIAAVNGTAGKVLLYNNAIIEAFFAASNGGQTERSENVWSTALPYFKIRNDPYDLANPYSKSQTVFFQVGSQADKPEDMPPGQTPGTAVVRYAEDDLDPRLADFMRTFAIKHLESLNASRPAGSKYAIAPEQVSIKAILDMAGIQTDAKPFCKHDPASTDDAAHDAGNCPSIAFTGARMTVLLKIQQENAAAPGGFDRLDYKWQFMFRIADYLKSSTYPQWQVFTQSNVRIYAVERGKDSNGRDAYKLINRRYGHGLGLSQRGAQQRAKDADPAISKYESILSFYYPGTVLTATGLKEPALTAMPIGSLNKVTFNSRGGTAIPAVSVKDGACVPVPADPARSGFTFAGWHKDFFCSQPWNFTTGTVSSDLMLYAHWTPVSAEAKVAAFVERFYLHVLNRDPDAAGLKSWTDSLVAHRNTGADVAYGIAFSDEFKRRQLSNADYVTIMYRSFFNREPDSAGYAGWMRVLENGMSRYYVLAGFVNSDEFKTLANSYGITPGTLALTDPADLNPEITAFVTRFYRYFLERMPDSVGINDWVANLRSGKSTGANVAYGFAYSQEFLDRKTSNETYVTIMYRAFLNREPDSGGYAAWLKVLASGGTRHQVLAGFVNSQEFTGLCADYGIVRGVLK